MGELADTINRTIREKQELEELIAIQHKFKNSPPLVAKNRVFIREGPLVKICRKNPKMRYFFLFTDCLVYARKIDAIGTTYMYHRMISLLRARVVDVSDTKRTTNAFQVLGSEKSFTLCCEDAAEKSSWMSSIQKAIDNLGGDEGGGNQAPVWVPDEESGACMLCGVKFTVVNRRHHCRRCGKIVCGKCSSAEFMLVNLRKLARVCNQCFDALVEMNGGWGVMQSRTNLYRIPKAVLAVSRVTIPADQWSEKNIREWVESVGEGKYVALKDVPDMPKNGTLFVQMSRADVHALFETLDGDDKDELEQSFWEEFEELKRRMYEAPQPQITIIPKNSEQSKTSHHMLAHKKEEQPQSTSTPNSLTPTPATSTTTSPTTSAIASPPVKTLSGPPRRTAPIAPALSDQESSSDEDDSESKNDSDEEEEDEKTEETKQEAKPAQKAETKRPVLPQSQSMRLTVSAPPRKPPRPQGTAPMSSSTVARPAPPNTQHVRRTSLPTGRPPLAPASPTPEKTAAALPTKVPREMPPTAPPQKYQTMHKPKPTAPPPTKPPVNTLTRSGPPQRRELPAPQRPMTRPPARQGMPQRNPAPPVMDATNPFYEDLAAADKQTEPEKKPKEHSTNPFLDDDSDEEPEKPQKICQPMRASAPPTPQPKASPRPLPKPLPRPLPKPLPKPAPAQTTAKPPVPKPPATQPVAEMKTETKKSTNPFDDDYEEDTSVPPVESTVNPFAIAEDSPRKEAAKPPPPRPPKKPNTNPFLDDDDQEEPAAPPPQPRPQPRPQPQPQPRRSLPTPPPRPAKGAASPAQRPPPRPPKPAEQDTARPPPRPPKATLVSSRGREPKGLIGMLKDD